MSFERSPMRYAHTNGYTGCTYTEKGDLIITCGSDGDIRTWDGIEDDDPISRCLGEFVLCTVHYDERLLASNDLLIVQAYTFPDCDKDGIEFHFTAPVTCIKINKEFIAACSEDMTIKAKNRITNEIEFKLEGHQGPVLHIDLNKNTLLASSSGDGTIKIWNLEEKKEIKNIFGLPKIKTFEMAKVFSTPTFDPKFGKYLAYSNGKYIFILSINDWEIQYTLEDDNSTCVYSCCAFSYCSQFIGAGTTKGDIIIWDLKTQKKLKEELNYITKESITSIAWNPKQNGELAYCDITGQLGIITINKVIKEKHNDFIESEAGEDDVEINSDIDILNNEDEDIDNDNCISLEKLKNETLRPNGFMQDDELTRDSDDRNTKLSSIERIIPKTYQQQESFQPSSTPKSLENRYLVWNNIGIVRAYSSETDKSIDVEFHDVNTHQTLHVNNYLNHTMASLGENILALSGDTSSKLVCIAFGTAGGSREWSVEFPDCECVVALTATNKIVAVATDLRFLRIFSIMGTQREVLTIPGPVVTVCGYEDKLMVVYHSAPATEDQYMSAILIQIFGLTIRSREIRLPLSPGKKLAWTGFSDRGSPVCFDTQGLLQMYSLKSNCWYPICDTTKHAYSISNNFFIIHVCESIQTIQAILCRGTTYPMTNPRPMVTEIPIQIPLCELDTEKGSLEEILIRYSNFSAESNEKVIKETAIKLFALACRSELEARAKELIEMIASPSLLPLAVKYATKLGRIHLADKLSELQPKILDMQTKKHEELHEIEMQAINILQNSPLNPSLLLTNKSQNEIISKTVPAPLPISHLRRNPFRKTSISSPTSSSSKSFSHLTEKIIGYDTKNDESQDMMKDLTQIENSESTLASNISDSEVIPSSINDNNTKTTPGRHTFMSWFNENKENLKEKYPDITAAELTKCAMKEFRNIPANKKENQSSGKRKAENDNNGKQAGIAKLAKFGFNKSE